MKGISEFGVGASSISSICLFVFGTILLVGCVPKVTIDGIETIESVWERDSAELVRRAGFDMDCKAGEMRLTLISVAPNKFPEQVGVEGCGSKGVYVKTTSGWVLNTEQSK